MYHSISNSISDSSVDNIVIDNSILIVVDIVIDKIVIECVIRRRIYEDRTLVKSESHSSDLANDIDLGNKLILKSVYNFMRLRTKTKTGLERDRL